MNVYIGTDHAGFELKEKLVPFVKSLGHNVVDCGAYEYNESDDYPDIIKETIRRMRSDGEGIALILGGSGQGEAMVANRFQGIRAIVYYGGNTSLVTLGREHNHANVLSLGARFLNEAEAKEAVQIFLQTEFSNDERHVRRINNIDKYSK